MAYRGGFSFGTGLTPWVQKLLIANGVVFLLTDIARTSIGAYLAFVPAAVLLRPWTPFTYMFVHGGFMHLFFNMLILYFFGPPLEQRFGSRDFIKFYLISGLGGAVFSFLFAFNHPVIGASAAVYGVMLAFAMNWPDAPIYLYFVLPVKVKYLVGFLAALAVVYSLGGVQDGTAHAAHLGGFVAAFLYLRFDDRIGRSMARMKKNLTRPRLTVVQGEGGPTAPAAPAAPRRRREDDDRMLDEVDRVLDKISASGLSSLSVEERRLLDEVSRRFRQN